MKEILIKSKTWFVMHCDEIMWVVENFENLYQLIEIIFELISKI